MVPGLAPQTGLFVTQPASINLVIVLHQTFESLVVPDSLLLKISRDQLAF